MLHRSTGLLLLPALFLGSLHLAAQQTSAQNPSPPVTIRTQARLVLLDVVVTDGHGHPVKGLKQADFTLYEDGVQQKLASFRERNASSLNTAQVLVEPKLPPNTFVNHAPITGDGTMTVLLFDHLSFADDAYLRGQMLAFIKTLKPGTPICIFRLDPELRLVQDFTTDPQVLHDAIASKRNQFRFETPYQRYAQTTDSMLELARYLSGFPGRKNLIWFSRPSG